MNAITYKTKNPYWWIIALAILTALYFSRCTTYQKCYTRYGTTVIDTTFHTFYDTASVSVKVPVPGVQISGSIDTEKLNFDSLVFVSSQGRAKATFWKDRYDSLRFKAECLPDTIKEEVHVPYAVQVPMQVSTISFEQPVKEQIRQNSFIERIAMWIGTGIMILVLILAVWFGGKKILETYFPAIKLLNMLK